jgi:hypothetical protein
VTGLLHERIGPKRVLVVLEAGAAGAAALDCARELAQREDAAVTVVGIAPQVPPGPRCGYSPGDYNRAVSDAVLQELAQAQTRLAGCRASFELLIEGEDGSLPQWSAMSGFDMVLLPAHRRPLRSPHHPAAAALTRAGVEIRIIDRRGRKLRAA